MLVADDRWQVFYWSAKGMAMEHSSPKHLPHLATTTPTRERRAPQRAASCITFPPRTASRAEACRARRPLTSVKSSPDVCFGALGAVRRA
ncbi:hypothetical protein GCM10009850_119060 [Nonomuraea monospora]|uniref:Uncharacterized protein n=1 Tax=Nonomuraea monospora TaxID=568818 RepID=A0ABN3D4B1_9ACTN